MLFEIVKASITPALGPRGNLALKPAPEEALHECPIRFQGQWQDEETGLYYNRHRYYDPLTAQYMSPDPLGLTGGDRPQGYVYNPTIWTDPFGLLQRLQAATDQAVRELTANPGLAESLMTPGSYNHLVVKSRLAPASWGKAVERRAAQILKDQKDPTLQWAGKTPQGPDGRFIGGPDFTGANGAAYDITTPGQAAGHGARSYGPTTTIVPQPGLPANLEFPP